MDRLLTEGEQRRHFWDDPRADGHEPPGFDRSHWRIPQLLQAQDTKSVRAGRNDVIGWLLRYSDIITHINTHHEDEWAVALEEWDTDGQS